MLLGSEGKNEEFKPQNEFKLDTWISLQIGPFDMSINKAVLYLFLGSALTIIAWMYIANRMQARPNRVQTAVETPVPADEEEHRRGQHGPPHGGKWFTFVGTLFLFIWFSNLIGYMPLPTNTEHKVDVFGVDLPVVRALRGDREHLGPARTDAGGLVPRITTRASASTASSAT